VQNLQNKIRQYNSYLEGAKREFEVVELYAELKRETAYLVETKSAINAANASIQGKIYEMAEYKGLAAFLKTVSTQSGRQVVSYGMAEPQVYVAQLSATDIDKRLGRLSKRSRSFRMSLTTSMQKFELKYR